VTSPVPKVIFAVGGLYTEASGVGRILCDLANALGRIGSPVTVYTAACTGKGVTDHMLRPPSVCVSRPGRWMGRLASSPSLRRLLNAVIPDVDVVHNHSVWMLPNHYASAAAHRCRKPVLFTAHGTLEPWAWRRSAWKKRLVGAWFQDRDLRRAACIHVNSVREMKSVRAVGLENPVAVVPNGVDLRAFATLPNRSPFDAAHPEAAGKRICLFLSRINSKKNVSDLVRAWHRAGKKRDGWHLVIAGPDDGDESAVRGVIRELHRESDVTLVGPVYGTAKLEALAAASVFVLPSHSEGFAMAVLEAMACRLPVVITPGCNFPEIAQAGAGIEVPPTLQGIQLGLEAMLVLGDNELAAMGARGQAMVEQAYTWDHVARQMLELYRWLAHGGSRPAFVV